MSQSEIADTDASTALNQSKTSLEDKLDEFVDADPFKRIYLNVKPRSQEDFADCRADVEKINLLAADISEKPKDFISNAARWTARQMFAKMQNVRAMDWGEKSEEATSKFTYYPEFRINTFRIVGEPLHPIVRSVSSAGDVTISRCQWQAPYSLRHATNTLPFELNERTFRFASGPDQQIWFIVLHPVVAEPGSRRTETVERSTIRSDRAQALSMFVNELLSQPDLSKHVQNGTVSLRHWHLVQWQFMNQWQNFVKRHAHDKFWGENNPAFHVLDHGEDTKLEPHHDLSSLPMEVPYDHNRVRDPGYIDESSDDEAIQLEPQGRPSTPPGGREEKLYTEDLNALKSKLLIYDLAHVDRVSYTVSAIIHCVRPPKPEDATEDKVPVCLLADRSKIRATCSNSAAEFHSLGFHPWYGNFVASNPPDFIAPLFTIMKSNMAVQNDGEDVLHFEAFRGYAHVFEVAVQDKLTQGRATAALTLSPAVRRCSSASVVEKHCNLNEQPPSTHLEEVLQSIQTSIDKRESGYRMDQVVTVKVSDLLTDHRKSETILRPLFQFMRFFTNEPKRYCKIMRAFEFSQFPEILGGFAKFFGTLFLEIEKRDTANSETSGLSPALCEGTALLSRLAEFCFTGDPTVLGHSVIQSLETVPSIQKFGWPFYSKNLLNLRDGGEEINLKKWPTISNLLEDSPKLPILLHVADLGFHFGSRVAAHQYYDLLIRKWGYPVNIQFLEKALRDIWIPEMVAAVARSLRFELNRASRQGTLSHAEKQDAETISSTLLSWEAEKEPFTSEHFDRLFPSESIKGLVKLTSDDSLSRRQYAMCLLRDTSAKHGSWFGMFHHIAKSMKDDSSCVQLLETALASAKVMWAPLPNGSPTLVVANLMMKTTVYPISSIQSPWKRKAAQAQEIMSRDDEPPRKRIIVFDGQSKIKVMPLLLEQGFAESITQYSQDRPKVARHFEEVRDFLKREIGQKRFAAPCELLVMLVLTLAGSSRTPWLNANKKKKDKEGKEIETGFTVTEKTKESSRYAAALATKMVWFLQRDIFFTSRETHISGTREMKELLEQYKVSYRTLIALGWIRVKATVRRSESARLSDQDCELRPDEDLEAYCKKLNRLRVQDTNLFFESVFGKQTVVVDGRSVEWAELCDSIFKQ
ncbi:hypothetical protein E4U13_006378 [Claviceps humidiphila]|uniref:Uncharacterized protein n=1 Tax=Claviceps humidiphila TaxID=1294629 RepID=A0A9P7PXE7_9HYPO|nr:hypothetical protein E4U13_006378 [Claviceps humidiphila]